MNIVKYEDDFIHSEKSALDPTYSFYIVMEYCPYGDLTDRIREMDANNERLSSKEVMSWFVDICKAIKYIHARGILHRDIKGPNVFVGEGNILKLGDFGLSRTK